MKFSDEKLMRTFPLILDFQFMNCVEINRALVGKGLLIEFISYFGSQDDGKGRLIIRNKSRQVGTGRMREMGWER